MINTNPKLFVFVMMPFSHKFDDIYNLGIKSACLESDVYCERVDEQIFEENIIERVYNQISKADIIISDMTDKNPNVFYETGYAHALGKSVILLTQNSTDIPFDLKQYPHIVYENITNLKTNLKRRIKWSLENSEKSFSSPEMGLLFYIGDTLLTENNEILYNQPKNNNDIRIFVNNPTDKVYHENSIVFQSFINWT